jgi:hypothetical protein
LDNTKKLEELVQSGTSFDTITAEMIFKKGKETLLSHEDVNFVKDIIKS